MDGNPLTTTVLVILTALSALASGLAIVAWRRAGRPRAEAGGLRRASGVLLMTCTAGAAALFVYRWLAHGVWLPLEAHVDGLTLMAALLGVVFLMLRRTGRFAGLTAFAMPGLSFVLLWGVCASAWTFRPFHLDTFSPVWRMVHLTTVYLGTTCAVLAAVGGGMYLVAHRRLQRKATALGDEQSKMPSLEALEALIIQGATLGFVLLTFGLASGVVVLLRPESDQQLGGMLIAKVIVAFLAWAFIALVMNVRYATHFRGTRAAWLSIVCVVLLFAVYGFVTTRHDAAPTDTTPPVQRPVAGVE